MRTGIYIGERRSSYAFDLARAADVFVLRRIPPLYHRRGGVIINWGCADVEALPATQTQRYSVINSSNAVRKASNKLRFFHHLRENAQVVEHCTTQTAAQQWADAGERVVARHVLNGHAGAGIEVVAPRGRVPQAPLYTKYFNGAREYRVHVWGNDTLIQQKRRRNGGDRADTYIRNAGPQWVFCVENVTPPTADLVASCKQVVAELGLTFGAVDVRQKLDGTFRILEVNTAPGVEGTALQFYAQKVLDIVNA